MRPQAKLEELLEIRDPLYRETADIIIDTGKDSVRLALKEILDKIQSFDCNLVEITGGEPLLRPDIFDIASYGNKLGLRMVMAPNGTLITEERVKRMIDSGIKRISVSLDGATREAHDGFRGVDGAYDGAIKGVGLAREAAAVALSM